MEEALKWLHAGFFVVLEVLYSCLTQQAGAGRLGLNGASETGQSLDSNQRASRCQENHAHSGPGVVPLVTSAVHTLLHDSVIKFPLYEP